MVEWKRSRHIKWKHINCIMCNYKSCIVRYYLYICISKVYQMNVCNMVKCYKQISKHVIKMMMFHMSGYNLSAACVLNEN